MINTDDLIQDIVDKEDELTQKHNVIIEQEVRNFIIKKYGEDSKKYLNTYFDDSDENLDISEDDCSECTEAAKNMISKINVITNNINLLNTEVNNNIIQNLSDCLPLKLKIIDMITCKLKQILDSMGYKYDNEFVKKLISLYLLDLSVTKEE